MIYTFIRNLKVECPEDKYLVVLREGELGKELLLTEFRVFVWGG